MVLWPDEISAPHRSRALLATKVARTARAVGKLDRGKSGIVGVASDVQPSVKGDHDRGGMPFID
jgi:hypothetical protein